MTNLELISKIKAEIERLKSNMDDRDPLAPNQKAGYLFALADVFSFLSTLEESKKCDGCNNVKGCVTCVNGDQWVHYEESEKPMQEGLEEELDSFIASGKSVTVEDCGTYKVSYHDFKKVARHFYELSKQSGSSEIPKDLEEAAKEYEDALGYYECMSQWPSVAFIDGAKWQEEKDTRDMYMSGNRDFEKVYQLGRADMREQMMKDAVEGKVAGDGEHCWIDADVPMSWLYQDKVRLIIVKED